MIRKAAIVVVAAVALLLAVGLVLPRRWRVERSVVIAGPSSRIHPLLATLRRWQEWSPWTKELDPVARFTFAGPDMGVGSEWGWIGPVLGRGRLVVLEADPARGLTLEERVESEIANAKATFRYEPVGADTRVTWTDEGTLPLVVGGFIRGRVEAQLGAHFEKGLAKLKTQVEALPPAPPPKPEVRPEPVDGGAEPAVTSDGGVATDGGVGAGGNAADSGT